MCYLCKDMNAQRRQMVEQLRRQGRLQEAVGMLEADLQLSVSDADVWMQLGLCLWKLGERQRAATAYAHAAALDPEGPASEALAVARRIEGFFNPDLLNP